MRHQSFLCHDFLSSLQYLSFTLLAQCVCFSVFPSIIKTELNWLNPASQVIIVEGHFA